MITPLQPFASWYRAQPNEVRDQIAFLVGRCVPGFGADSQEFDCLLKPQEPFQAWLDEELTTFQTLGKTISLRGIISFLVIRDSDSQDDWDEKIELNQAILAEIDPEGTSPMALKLRDAINRMPDQAKLWIPVTESWKKLLNSSLSDEAIEAWWHEARLRNLDDKSDR
jgi:hypothetical protein